MQTSENLSYRTLKLTFNKDFVGLMLDTDRNQWQNFLRLRIMCRHLDWQVSSAIQIFGALSPVLSVVEKLTLGDVEESRWLGEVGRSHWRGLLGPFNSVKSLCVSTTLVRGLSHSLCLEGEEMPLELLPYLRELQYFGGFNAYRDLIPFINERNVAGHALKLVGPDPVRDLNIFLSMGNLARHFSWVMSREGPDLQATHYSDAMFCGILVGQGRGVSVGAAKREAALQALANLRMTRNDEIPETRGVTCL
ncbi:hypothetical protein BGW80DRAFT_1289221 [Lactifluus volemus]|nr:hypothetical protein BGW80DRAFT_1289221 [Lactifluus volemus]